jgi:hypothetical protein
MDVDSDMDMFIGHALAPGMDIRNRATEASNNCRCINQNNII